jgi:hypothetical protein
MGEKWDRIFSSKSRATPKDIVHFFLIKWKGYPESANSWEPIHHVSKELIEDWRERQPGRKLLQKPSPDAAFRVIREEDAEPILNASAADTGSISVNFERAMINVQLKPKLEFKYFFNVRG